MYVIPCVVYKKIFNAFARHTFLQPAMDINVAAGRRTPRPFLTALMCCFVFFRQSLGNGTLYFPPFRVQDQHKDVHSTVYRCRATNLVGTIISRDVHVRAGEIHTDFFSITFVTYLVHAFPIACFQFAFDVASKIREIWN